MKGFKKRQASEIFYNIQSNKQTNKQASQIFLNLN